MPGPGAYLSNAYSNTGVEITLGVSRKAEERESSPGPAAYNNDKTNVQNRPQTAKIGKSQRFYKMKTESSSQFYESTIPKTPKYSFSRNKKLNDKCPDGPGPGAYRPQTSMSNLSSYARKK